MKEYHYPRVLIIGEIFRLDAGGGITLSNLFKDWPSERLAVIATGVGKASGEICHNYYQLGKEEIKTVFPFGLMSKPNKSGPLIINRKEKRDFTEKTKRKNNIIISLIKKVYRLPLNFFGIYHATSYIIPSSRLKEWVTQFNPSLIYCQIFSFTTIQLVTQVQHYTKRPLVIHIMDDFVNIIIKPGILKFYWQSKLNNKFQDIIDTSSVCLSISNAMSLEYEKRYKKKFYDFRNPVEVGLWLPFSKSNWEYKKKFKLLHAGRLVSPVSQALFDICEVVTNLNKNGIEFEFDITTFDRNAEFETKIKSFVGININKPVRHEEMPQLIAQYDLLVLPIDFTKRGIRYTKYSISSKTSEFLISGVPILVYAPEEVAIYKYFRDNGLGFTANRTTNINKLLVKIKGDPVGREEYGKRTIEFAKNKEDSVIVREKFRNLLANTISKADK